MTLPQAWAVNGAILSVSYIIFAADLLSSYPSGFDGLVYHLPLSLRWLQEGSLAIPASRVFQYSMPGNSEVGMMLLLATGKQAFSPLMNSLSLVVLAVSIYLIARKCTGDGVASTAAVAVLLTIPMFQFQAFSTYVDLSGTAFLMAAIALFLCRRQADGGADARGWSWKIIALSGLACGISIGTKAVFYPYAAIFLLIGGVVLVRERAQDRKALVLAIAALCLSCALPSGFWFWRAFQATGNPVYPLQVAVGSHLLFHGYPSTAITALDVARDHASSVLGWLAYPWTERKADVGFLLLSYGVDSGLGGTVASFVPLGLAFCAYLCKRRVANRAIAVLLLAWIVMLLFWWFALRHDLRYGMPLWALSCALTAPLLAYFRRLNSIVIRWVLTCSLLVTCSISTLSPLHDILARFRSRNWTRSHYYEYPSVIDQLPTGSRALNRGYGFNFPLAGKSLTTTVVPGFEAPADLDARYLAAAKIDFVVESSDVEQHLLDLRKAGGELIYERPLVVSDSGRRTYWRVWKITQAAGAAARELTMNH